MVIGWWRALNFWHRFCSASNGTMMLEFSVKPSTTRDELAEISAAAIRPSGSCAVRRSTGRGVVGACGLAAALSLFLLLICSTSARAADDGIRVTIYPILVKAPIFGASVDLPSLPSAPGGGGGESGEVSGTTDVSLNAAYMGAILIEANRWFVEGAGTWAALSADRSSPRINIKTETLFYSARGGVRLVGGLSATAGVRRATVDIDATLTLILPDSERPIQGRTKPGFWDPLVGIDWRQSPGAWTFDGNIQYGGFGVGTDEEASAEFHARWRFVPHVELRAGYSLLYFKLTVADVSIGSFRRTMVAKQTLHGPEIGLGFFF